MFDEPHGSPEELERAFSIFVHTNAEKLRKVAARYVWLRGLPWSCADDIWQEALALLWWNERKLLLEDDRCFAWTCATMSFKAANIAKSASVRRCGELTDELLKSLPSTQVDSGDAWDNAHLARLALKCVGVALQKLSSVELQVFDLSIAGATSAEIGRQLEMPAERVRRIRRRNVQSLRESVPSHVLHELELMISTRGSAQ